MSNDKTGYKKPPKHTRFKKGQSGNPAGRPKGRKSLNKRFEEMMAEKVTIVENGERKQVAKGDLLLKSLFNQATKGNIRAADMLLKRLDAIEYEQEAHKMAKSGRDIDEADIEILRKYMPDFKSEEGDE